jgi:hypothetical protein
MESIPLGIFIYRYDNEKSLLERLQQDFPIDNKLSVLPNLHTINCTKKNYSKKHTKTKKLKN